VKTIPRTPGGKRVFFFFFGPLVFLSFSRVGLELDRATRRPCETRTRWITVNTLPGSRFRFGATGRMDTERRSLRTNMWNAADAVTRFHRATRATAARATDPNEYARYTRFPSPVAVFARTFHTADPFTTRFRDLPVMCHCYSVVFFFFITTAIKTVNGTRSARTETTAIDARNAPYRTNTHARVHHRFLVVFNRFAYFKTPP